MRKFAITTLVLFFCMFQVVWADDNPAFSVTGPVQARHLIFQHIEDGKLLVSVTDKEENPIMGLMPKDFSILRGDKRAKILDVEPLVTNEDVGLNIVLVVDNSFSMSERDAVQPLLTALEELFKMIRPIDQIA